MMAKNEMVVRFDAEAKRLIRDLSRRVARLTDAMDGQAGSVSPTNWTVSPAEDWGARRLVEWENHNWVYPNFEVDTDTDSGSN